MALLFIAFVAGLLTVLAPCTLPLLPVIVGGSVSGKSTAWRALIIASALGASVFLFTLVLKVSTVFINVPQEFWNIVSGGLLIIFGLVTLFPQIWEKFSFANTLNLSGNRLLAQGYTRQGIIGDIIMGAALGPVFSSCSPTYFIVLATVLPVHPAEGIIYLLAYCIGLIISLVAVSIVGQRVVLALGVATDPYGWFKRAVGALFLIIGVVIALGWSQTIESDLLSHAGMFDVTQIEQHLLLSNQNNQNVSTTTPMGELTPAEEAAMYQKAPELAGIDGYINTDGQPITLASLKGKVVLIDFWTYSCINCLRTIPYLNAWYQKYKDDGLVIIGVETPEFAFEHLTSNVEAAVKSLGIQYPVVQDNEYQTWDAFNNEYWPNEYLINKDGYIVYTHSGEGDYAQDEQAIQNALGISTSTVATSSQDLSDINSPETYFGSNRNEYLGNGQPGQSGSGTFTLPTATQVQADTLYLGGQWTISPEYAQNSGPAQIEYQFDSDDIYFVAAADASTTIEVYLDGKPVGSQAGSDVDPTTSEAVIKDDRLYRLAQTSGGVHTLEIKVLQGSLQAYTFTFG